MLCDNCHENEANVMYSENINGKKKELHLCRKCSQELEIENIGFNMKMPIDFSSFFAGMLEELQNPEFMPMFDNIKELECKNCGYKFEDIINTGKIGCANCYDTFESKIDPIIKKIQGSSKHVGRIGKISENKIKINNIRNLESNKEEKNEVEKLKEELKKVIKEEKYEKAAKIRDEIIKIENKRSKEK